VTAIQNKILSELISLKMILRKTIMRQ